MFTGIIAQVTEIKAAKQTGDGLLITFVRPKGWDDLELGESIATDGVCLTVAALRGREYDCLVTPETLAKTSFGSRLPKSVNLERALSAKDRFGGHFVQGHVDGVGTVAAIDKSDGWRVTVQFDGADRELVIYKGSITVNGVSLTIASVDGNKLQLALVPHTLQHTTLDSLRAGDQVNLEFDVLGKYVINSIKVRREDARSPTSNQ